jgi:Collagen triple helix repeat (20 copies)
MANNLIQIKRTSVSGRIPNTSILQTGELALNMADGILYSSNGTAVFEIGANNTNQNISGNLTVKSIIANSSVGSAGQVLYTDGSKVYWGPGAAGFTGSIGATGFTGSAGTNGNDGFTGSKGDTGFTGSKGNDGSTGSAGFTGSQGIQGVTGYTGSQGDRGDLGFTGSQGGTGYTGSKGDTGSTGSQGTTGFTGSKGDQGTTGFVGSKGDTGFTGSQGPQGTFGGAAFDYTFNANTDNSDPGNGGLKFSNTNASLATTLYISENADNFQSVYNFLQTIDDSTSSIKGHFTVTEKANTEHFALFSITGFHTHYTNYFAVPTSFLSGSNTFNNGLDIIITFARTGDIGDPGYTGSKGDVGYTGSLGFTGSIGYTGSQGDVGFTGSKGDQGSTGFVGSQGGTGFTGSKGDQGNVGFTGSQGSQGTTGFTGSAGTNGTNGTNGYTGSKGDLGYTGSVGPNAGIQNQILYKDSSNTLVGSSNLTFNGSTFSVNGFIESTYAAGDEGGEIHLAKPLTNSTISGSVNIDIYQNRLRIFESSGSNRGAYIDLTAAATGVGSNLLAASSAGFTGSKGDTGFTGSIGYTGSQGSQGTTGYTGSQGNTGYTGSKGDVGVTGLTGYTGSAGTNGTNGTNGSDGFTGSKGDIGFTGSSGPVAGSDKQIIFNDGGYANGSSGLTFNKTSNLLSVNGSLQIAGNVYITGNVTTFVANNLSVTDNMIYLNSNSLYTNPDLGFAGNYNDGSYKHAGFFRDHTSGIWKVFDGYTPEPDASQFIDQTNTSFRVADFQANTLYTNKISANGSIGSAGQILASNGSGLYWTTDQVSNNITTVVLTTNTLNSDYINIGVGYLTVGNSTVNTTVTNSGIRVSNTSSNVFLTLTDFRVPVGNTAQRPANATTGFLRFNTDNTDLEYAANSTKWYSITTQETLTSNNISVNNNITIGNSTVNSVVSATSITTPAIYLTSDVAGFNTYSTQLSDSPTKSVSIPSYALNSANGAGYTVEFFVKFDTLSTSGTMTNMTPSGVNQLGMQANTTTINIYNAGYTSYNFTLNTPITTGVWYHIAYIGYRDATYIAVNGSTVYSSNRGGYSAYNATGTWGSGWRGLTGPATYSNLRVVTGRNIYNVAGFIPPTQNLTPITGTQVLTLQDNTFKDNSTNNGSITTSGSPTLAASTVLLTNIPYSIAGSIVGGVASLPTVYTQSFYANNSLGTSGQILTSNGTGIYWSNSISGAITATTLQASAITVDIGDITVGNNSSNSYISNTNIIVSNSAGFSANISTSSIRIGNAVSNSVITSTSIRTPTINTTSIFANSSYGTAGQVLTSNGTGVYWSTAVGYAGSQGSQGTIGYTGSQGSQGSQGTTGFTGSAGTNGTNGYTGSQGLIGYTGSAGTGGGGGGASVSVSTTAPVSPNAGDLWWNSDLGSLYIYYNDGDTSQWVTAIPTPASTSNNSTTSITLIPGTTTDAPLRFQSGTNLTTANAGVIEYNGTNFFATPIGTQRGIIFTPQYYRLESNNTLSSTNVIQSIFGVGATVSGSTVYNFEALYLLSRASGTTSHTMGISFGGTATYNNFGYVYHRYASQLGFNQDVGDQTGYVTSNTLITITSARTSAYTDYIQIRGTFSCNTGGTIIPQLKYSAAPGGTTDVVYGSYIAINPVGTSGSNTSIGTWA